MCLGKRGNAYVIASESCALTSVSAEFIRDIEPGEILTITKDGLKSNKELASAAAKRAHCVFEYIYFARLDSTIDGVKVYDARIRGGKSLAKSYPVEADLVTGVPESDSLLQRDTPKHQESRLHLRSIKTAILEEHLSNRLRKNVSPVFI